MKIIVCIKQTFDTEAKISLTGEGKIDPNGVHLIVNPYDEYAIEEGVRLKEKFGGEVTVLSMGTGRAQEALRPSLATVADRALRIRDPGREEADGWVTAQVLSAAIETLSYDVIITGRMAIDDGAGQVGVRLAENLHIPSITSVVKLEVAGDHMAAFRETFGGTEQVEAALPVLLTAQKGLNEPRYPAVLGMMKAKKKEIATKSLADLGLNSAGLPAKMKRQAYFLAAPRQAGRKLAGDAAQAVEELAAILREEIKVI